VLRDSVEVMKIKSLQKTEKSNPQNKDSQTKGNVALQRIRAAVASGDREALRLVGTPSYWG
jgi:hypothetical protein